MELTSKIISSGTGCRKSVAVQWTSAIDLACKRFGIESENAVACFLANVGVESENLTVLVENLNYSARGLANTWPERFAVNPHANPRVPNMLAISLAHKPQQIANNVYANRLGNGDEASGDGWRYRGHGPIQITGKSEIERCGAAIGLDLVADPDQLDSPMAGAASAAWFFVDSGALAAADAGDFPLAVKHINGAFPCDANNGPLREARYRAALAAIKAHQSSGGSQPAQGDAAV